ncbi:MAG: TonB-dependent receptor [Acidobacteria bacterium]|nr:TonB-dependent receptor [Acidobacteriota bacterium]
MSITGDKKLRIQTVLSSALITLLLSITAFAQSPAVTGTIRGVVHVEPSGMATRNAVVTISELRRSMLTDENGAFEFIDIPVGKYQIIAHLDRVPDVVKTVEVRGGDQMVDFQLTLAPVSEQVTVTATGSAEAIGSSYQSVTSVGALELAQRNPVSIGEALEYQLGVAKRSFGPGSGRPVIRGFDGDRVLVLQDGLRVGGIASQSGDEVEPIDVLSLDRVEIVKGPATLLYGSNAIGGVVNGISTNDVYQNGLSGYLTAFGSTNNWQAGTSGGFKYGFKNFLFFANGGAQKANDYRTSIGTVLNSYSRSNSVSGGVGWFPRKGWLAFNYTYDRRRYGIPVEPDEIDFEYLKMRRHSYEAKGGLRELGGFIEGGDFAVSYNDYINREFEFESDENVTELDSLATNKNFNYRANFNHRRRGKFSGTFGLSGFTRDYESIGEEAPAPRTRQNSFAVYGLERVDFERVGFQFGGRIEQNGYDPEGNFRKRNFVGFSGSAGLRVPLWKGGSFVANYQHSFRAPALEELYNNGPHPGILVFDVGNPNLNPEQGDGVDFSLRHNTERMRLEGSVYYYNIRNFVYTAFTGATDAKSNLPIVDYAQGRSRYVGTEASVEARVSRTLWLSGKVDYVRAELTGQNKPLPRIPPFRGTLGLDWRYKALSVRPELILANRQVRVFDNETPTAGYALFNLNASYTFVTGRAAHIVSVGGYNLGDTLYRNHLSFIKNIAPEMGRNVRLNYSLRF